MTIEEVWNNIKSCEGQTFHTITGLPFQYEIHGDSFKLSRTNQNIGKVEVEKAFKQMPLRSSSQINSTVRGPSYVFALLKDERIYK